MPYFWICIACMTGLLLGTLMEWRIDENKKRPHDGKTWSDE